MIRRIAVLAAALILSACSHGLAAPAQSSSPSSPASIITPTPPYTPISPTQNRAIPTRYALLTPTPTYAASPAPSPSPTSVPSVDPTIVEHGQLAPGFSLTDYASVPAPTSLVFGPDGRLYVASTNSAVYVVADRNGTHRGADVRPYAVGLDTPLGLAWVGKELFVSIRGSVVAVSDPGGGGFAETRRTVIANLPSFGLHQNDNLALGSDGYLYLGQGSTCDHCLEADPRSGTILRFKPNGAGFGIYARGLRNPYGVAFNSLGDLFATNNSRDDMGPAQPPDTFDWVLPGHDYGWPNCWPGKVDPACASVTQPVATFDAHTSPDGLAFYTAHQFPPDYFDNAFVAILGSIYMFPSDTQRGVARVRLTKTAEGYTAQWEWFLRTPDGRPVAITVGPDGALYVADYENGLIYRIVYGAP